MSALQGIPLTPKLLTHKEALITSGLRSCPGCGAMTIVRQVLLAIDEQAMISNAAGCLEVATGL